VVGEARAFDMANDTTTHHSPLTKTNMKRIVSGGQTGVDRAALDIALELGIPCGGWCPRGRRAEDGPIPENYPLAETPSQEYPERTEWNVRDADGTLILTRGKPDRGTALTVKLANRHRKPVFVVDLSAPANDEMEKIRTWLRRQSIAVLNVAGPRESSCAGISAQASAFLRKLLTKCDGELES
jgi:predicted Rossmann-fold nucleotide-binding protein